MKFGALRLVFRRIEGRLVALVPAAVLLLLQSFQLGAAEVSLGKEIAARLTLFQYEQPALHTFLQGINFPSITGDSGSDFAKVRSTGNGTWEFFKIFTRLAESHETGLDSTFALFRRNMPARHNYMTYAKVQAGIGQFFPGDTVGLSRIHGAGVDDPRYFYMQLNFRF